MLLACVNSQQAPDGDRLRPGQARRELFAGVFVPPPRPTSRLTTQLPAGSENRLRLGSTSWPAARTRHRAGVPFREFATKPEPRRERPATTHDIPRELSGRMTPQPGNPGQAPGAAAKSARRPWSVACFFPVAGRTGPLPCTSSHRTGPACAEAPDSRRMLDIRFQCSCTGPGWRFESRDRTGAQGPRQPEGSLRNCAVRPATCLGDQSCLQALLLAAALLRGPWARPD